MGSQTDRKNGITGNLGIKDPVRCATTANITLSGLQTIDGITVVADDRVLVKDQTDATENGIYIASSSTWQRATDFDGTNDVTNGTFVGITGGTAYANQLWQLSATNPITIGTTSLSFIYILTTNSSDNLSTLAALASVANLSTLANLTSVANLSALANLAGAANKIARFTGVGAMELIDLIAASTTASGIVELLTDAETASAIDTTRAMTAANLASLFGTSTRSTNSEFKIPLKVGGVFVSGSLQMGKYSSGSHGPTITFPSAFPTATVAVLAIGQDSSGKVLTNDSVSTSQAVFSQYDLSGGGNSVVPFYWFAIGY